MIRMKKICVSKRTFSPKTNLHYHIPKQNEKETSTDEERKKINNFHHNDDYARKHNQIFGRNYP